MNTLLRSILKLFFSVEPRSDSRLNVPAKILIVRQHNQLGDLLAGHSIISALKDKYPHSHITFIAGPQNVEGVKYNEQIDRIFVFDKKNLWSISYLNRFLSLLGEGYDWVIVPSVVSLSFTSNFIGRLARAKIRIGAARLNSVINQYSFFFNYPIPLDWSNAPSLHIGYRVQLILKPFGIQSDDITPRIQFSNNDLRSAEEFLRAIRYRADKKLIGIHPGAGKIPNRWAIDHFAELIKKLQKKYDPCIYITGTFLESELFKQLAMDCIPPENFFLDHTIPELAALIAASHLFLTNDTGIMHVAASTAVSQISLFGPTEPTVWAPVGLNKISLWKGNDINEISVADVFTECERLLSDRSG